MILQINYYSQIEHTNNLFIMRRDLNARQPGNKSLNLYSGTCYVNYYLEFRFLFSQAALLSSGASIIGMASDIAGSCRIPAMFTGVFGHKPSPGKLYPTLF